MDRWLRALDLGGRLPVHIWHGDAPGGGLWHGPHSSARLEVGEPARVMLNDGTVLNDGESL